MRGHHAFLLFIVTALRKLRHVLVLESWCVVIHNAGEHILYGILADAHGHHAKAHAFVVHEHAAYSVLTLVC